MKRTCLLASALAITASGVWAQQDGNGVYVQVDDSAVSMSSTKSNEIFHSCDGNSAFAPIGPQSGLAYCPNSAQVKVAWKIMLPLSEGGGFRLEETIHSVDDSDSGHCGDHEAVVFEVQGCGVESLCTNMEKMGTCELYDLR